MRAIVLGARGAVGGVIVDELRRGGHDVLAAGRSAANDVRVDLSADDGMSTLTEASASVDVVVNASGIEDPRLSAAVPAAVLLDISASAGYLAALRDAAPSDGRVVVGVGLAPGLTTAMVAQLDTRPGDEVDVAIMLGSGEVHGPAAVQWTADLIGRAVHDPAESGRVMNLRSARTFRASDGARRHLRADFPDHHLASGALQVRSWLAVTSRAATSALGAAGWMPVLRPLVARAPHVGSSAWRVQAVSRRTGETVEAEGVGQSRATGTLAALAAERAAALPPGSRATSADLFTVAEATDALAERVGDGHRRPDGAR
jgi:hypothetical protein